MASRVYIGIWDPNDPREAASQINTQPMLPPWRVGERKVMFLLLEGERTTGIGAELVAILRRHHMTGP